MAAGLPTGADSTGYKARRIGLWLASTGLALLLGALIGVTILLRVPSPAAGGWQIATAAQAPDSSVASRTLVASPVTSRPALSELGGVLRGIVLCGLVAAIGAALVVLGVGRLRDVSRQAIAQETGNDPEEL